ncbi:MAG TPA: hypothetical protein VMF65_13890 [Acidimicrobiales bacterium]|nr:hypothetical protein [Acidimicrobiales bacterium]
MVKSEPLLDVNPGLAGPGRERSRSAAFPRLAGPPGFEVLFELEPKVQYHPFAPNAGYCG